MEVVLGLKIPLNKLCKIIFFSILVHCDDMYEMYSVIESSKDTKKNAY